MNETYVYCGTELDLFSKAKNWKNYYGKFLKNYIKNSVLEVGAGIGGTTKTLFNNNCKKWICLEPDILISKILKKNIEAEQLKKYCKVKTGFISDLNANEFFNTILYIDVIEHIKNDKEEIELAISKLQGDGIIAIVVPAHQWLYTPFDKAIGHYRRYNQRTLLEIMPECMTCIKLIYLDSIGLLASLANRLILKSNMPSIKQILLWDRILIPLSRICDPLVGYKIGKSLVGIWRKDK